MIKHRAASLRRTRKCCGKIEEMAAEHPKVLCAASGVFFAARANLEKCSDFSGGAPLLDDRQDGVITVAMSDGEFDVPFGAGGHDLIRLTRCTAKGFLDV